MRGGRSLQRRAVSLSIALGALVCAPLHAHHSAANFDTRTEIVVEGVVTKYDWRNPHVYMALEVERADGTRAEQEVEAGASSVLLPLGLTQDSVQIGERVAIRANPSRAGEGRIVLGRELTKADGTVLPLNIGSRSARAPSTAEAASIAGTWFSPLTSFREFGGSQREWQLTPKAQAAREAYDGTTQSAHAQCIPVTTPMVMVYPVVITVEVNPDTVIFNVDWMTTRRVVYLDGRGHPENAERTLNGHSIGRWEGDTLVVDTTLFADHREGLAFGIPSGARKHVSERFSLSDDRRHLDYEATFQDPEHLTAPVSFAAPWEYRPELAPTGLACDLDVAQRFLSYE
jgi:hypothetical protein